MAVEYSKYISEDNI